MHKRFELSLFNCGTLKVSRWSPQECRFPIHSLHREGTNKEVYTYCPDNDLCAELNKPLLQSQEQFSHLSNVTLALSSNYKTSNHAALLWLSGFVLLQGSQSSTERHPLGYCSQKASGVPKHLSQNILHISLHFSPENANKI